MCVCVVGYVCIGSCIGCVYVFVCVGGIWRVCGGGYVCVCVCLCMKEQDKEVCVIPASGHLTQRSRRQPGWLLPSESSLPVGPENTDELSASPF